MQRARRHDGVERPIDAPRPVGRVERAVDEFDAAREARGAVAAEGDTLPGGVVTDRSRVPAVLQDRHRERAVPGAQIEHADRLLARMRDHQNRGGLLHVADRALALGALVPAVDEAAALPGVRIEYALVFFHAPNIVAPAKIVKKGLLGFLSSLCFIESAQKPNQLNEPAERNSLNSTRTRLSAQPRGRTAAAAARGRPGPAPGRCARRGTR